MRVHFPATAVTSLQTLGPDGEAQEEAFAEDLAAAADAASQPEPHPTETAASPSASQRRSAAKSSARPSEQVDLRPEPDLPQGPPSVKAEEDGDEEGLVEDSTDERGAGTSDADFRAHFDTLVASNVDFQSAPTEHVDTSDTILEKVKYWTQQVKAQFAAEVPDYVVRLCVGYVYMYTYMYM